MTAAYSSGLATGCSSDFVPRATGSPTALPTRRFRVSTTLWRDGLSVSGSASLGSAARSATIWRHCTTTHKSTAGPSSGWSGPVDVGRVVLIGDAAHASSPMMGQGGCMAMEDALVLAETLHASADVEGALDLFAIRRKPRVEWVQQESRAVGEMLRIPPERRDAVLRERGERASGIVFGRSRRGRSDQLPRPRAWRRPWRGISYGIHRDADGFFYVVSGTFDFELGDRIVNVPAGRFYSRGNQTSRIVGRSHAGGTGAEIRRLAGRG